LSARRILDAVGLTADQAVVGHGEWPAGIIALSLLWIAISLVMKHSEGNFNEHFSTLRNALFTMTQCVLCPGNAPVPLEACPWFDFHWDAGALRAPVLVAGGTEEMANRNGTEESSVSRAHGFRIA